MSTYTQDNEKAELVSTLAEHRYLFTMTVRDLTDEQAALTPTVSALSLGGLIKHVTATEAQWADFIVRGAAAFAEDSDGAAEDSGGNAEGEPQWADGFTMEEGETLAGLLAEYSKVAARTEAIIAEVADLNASHELPPAPWFEPGVSWSARRVMLHLVAETSQHAGHADILRETIDGAKTMG